MTARGRSLELAVKWAAVDYRKEGRALLVQQHPRTASKDGMVVMVGSAPADFMGAIAHDVDGVQLLAPAAVEAKQHGGKSFPLAAMDEEQRGALTRLFDFGFDVRLVVHLTDVGGPAGECYVCDWADVGYFIGAPYRKSLSLTWLRAYGLVVPITSHGVHPRALFLDATAHPDQEECLLECWETRRTRPVISLDAPDLESDPEPQPRPKRTPEEIRARVMAAMNDGLERQLKQASRARKWRRRA